jgi:hypothetical protein
MRLIYTIIIALCFFSGISAQYPINNSAIPFTRKIDDGFGYYFRNSIRIRSFNYYLSHPSPFGKPQKTKAPAEEFYYSKYYRDSIPKKDITVNRKINSPILEAAGELKIRATYTYILIAFPNIESDSFVHLIKEHGVTSTGFLIAKYADFNFLIKRNPIYYISDSTILGSSIEISSVDSFYKYSCEHVFQTENKKITKYEVNIKSNILLDSVWKSFERKISLIYNDSGNLLSVSDKNYREADIFTRLNKLGYEEGDPRKDEKSSILYTLGKHLENKEITYLYDKNKQLSKYIIRKEITVENKTKRQKQVIRVQSNSKNGKYQISYEPVTNHRINFIPDIGFDKAFWAIFELKGKRIVQKLFFDEQGVLEKTAFYKGKHCLLSRNFKRQKISEPIEIIEKFQPDEYFPDRQGYEIHESSSLW